MTLEIKLYFSQKTTLQSVIDVLPTHHCSEHQALRHKLKSCTGPILYRSDSCKIPAYVVPSRRV